MSKNEYHSSIGNALILVGGILALISSFMRLAYTFFIRRVLLRIASPQAGTRLAQGRWLVPHMAQGLLGLMFIGALVTIVSGIIAIYAFTRVRSGSIKNGSLLAIIAAVLILVTNHWIAGIFVLLGGIICYTLKSDN